MIDCISGVVKSVHEKGVSVSVGGIGFAIQVPKVVLFKIDQKINLYIHMHWNQDQGPTLFGFETELEKKVFLLVISCSGIGPKIGLAVLRDLGAESFLEAVQLGKEKVLSRVGGLGPKKVEQMIVQLKSKIDVLIKSGIEIQGSGALTDWQNLSDVLASLNYSRGEVTQAMNYLTKNYTGAPLPFDVLVRHALSFLAKKR